MATIQSEKSDHLKSEKDNHKVNKKSVEKSQKKKTDSSTKKKTNKKPRRRIFPIWLRIIVVLLLAAVALIVGLMIGYGVLGDGVPRDALKLETWQHIIDIVKKTQ